MKKLFLSLAISLMFSSPVMAQVASDHRYMSSVTNLTGCTEQLNSTRPVKYLYDPSPAAGWLLGFIAHELEAALSAGDPPLPLYETLVTGEYVDAPADPWTDTLQQVDLVQLTALIVCSLQEADNGVQEASNRLDDMDTWIAATETQMEDLETAISNVTSPSWSSVTGKPSTFTPSTHSHAISETTGLQSALDSKPTAKLVTFTGTSDGSGLSTHSLSGFTAPKCFASVAASAGSEAVYATISTCSSSSVVAKVYRNKTTGVLLGGTIDPDEVVASGVTVNVLVVE